VIFSLLGYWYANLNFGFYIDFYPDAEIKSNVKTEHKNILVNSGDGYEEFTVKGVTLDSSLPGHYATDYKANEETYLRWFDEIAAMGANTIRLNQIMDDDFYNAFYAYNISCQDPLYLIQSIWVEDYAQNSANDAYESVFFSVLKENCRTAVDVIHGKRTVSLGRVGGSGTYRKDVSKWTIGYIVGTSWNPNVIAYTDHSNENGGSFSGKYIQTTDESSPFENLLAEVMDDILTYESQKYKEQRLVSFVSEPATDPFEYTYDIKLQTDKIVSIDANHFIPTGDIKSGFFASYQSYDYITDFSKCLADSEVQRLAEYFNKLDKNTSDFGYIEMLNLYHEMPVLISSYGFSTARGIDNVTTGFVTEQKQGESLVNKFDEIIEAGCCGAVISTWQDTWANHTWNTQHAIDTKQEKNWCDAQSVDQKYGLMSFDPGKTERLCYIDGDPSEWDEKDLISVQNNQSISVKYDEEYVYFMVKEKNLNQQEAIYISIDTTPKSGSYESPEYSVSFDRPADFLIEIKGKESARLLVQDYYDSTRAMYEKAISGVDPYMDVPDPYSSEFNIARMVLKKSPDPLVNLQQLSEEQRFLFNLLPTYETGRLHYGNGNPSSKDYNSQADYTFGSDCVEIRIPWQLLNFSDPSNMMIHDDYYQNYGVEKTHVDKMYVGVGNSGEAPIEMSAVKLNGWGNHVDYHERLKESYYIIQKSWS
jgi:hypothetical protein